MNYILTTSDIAWVDMVWQKMEYFIDKTDDTLLDEFQWVVIHPLPNEPIRYASNVAKLKYAIMNYRPHLIDRMNMILTFS